ncbi:MAG: hypothetical protein ACXAC2_07985, partial [Candidatus Kariarchaeaceae archaeon]
MFTFTLTIFIGLIIIIGSSSIFTISFYRTASDDAGEVVLDEELINLERLVKDKALLIEGQFDQLTAEVRYLANYAEDLFNGRIPVTPRDTYIGIGSQDPSFQAPPNIEFSPMQNAEVSFEASAYYVPEITSITEIDTGPTSMITNSSYLDFAFQSIFTANPLYMDAYIGFSSGLYRTYPYRDMTTWQTKTYTSSLTGESRTGFDPRHADFFVDGVAKGQDAISNQEDIRYAVSKPNFNTEGIGLEIALYQSVYFDNGTLIGVVGTNLTMGVFESNVNNLQVLETGYAFLVDEDMNVVVHRDMDTYESETPITELEFSNGSDQTKEIEQFAPILNEMGSFNSGQTSFTKNSEKWYVSYFPIITPKFSLAIVISENQILSVADKITSEAYNILIGQLLLFFIISVIFGVITLYIIQRASKKIVEPIIELTQVTNQITQGNLKGSVDKGVGGSKEVVLLFETFRGLVTALRFGNEDYYAGNLKRAMSNYQNALQL